MKATKSGQVIGQAMSSFDSNNEEYGKVLVFVKNTYFNGEQLVESDGSDLTGISLLQKLLEYRSNISNDQSLSNIVTDRLAAGVEIVTPQITVESIIAKSIKADHIEGLEIMETGIAEVQDSAEDSAGRIRTLGEKFSDMQKEIKSIKANYGNSAWNSLVELGDRVKFKSIVEFVGRVIFHKDVEFDGQVIFNQNTAGYAMIKEGQDNVRIVFEEKYAVVPIVNASLSLQRFEDSEVRKAAEDLLLLNDVKFIVTNVSEKGFEIRISERSISDIQFSWHAIAVKDPKTSESKDDKKKEEKKDDVIIEENDNAIEETLITNETTPASDARGSNDGIENSAPTLAPSEAETAQ
jgi:hypothetical protein